MTTDRKPGYSLARIPRGVWVLGYVSMLMDISSEMMFATLVADASPPELRGTAYGYFNLLTGLAMLAASIIAGALWDAYGPAGTFLAGLVFALVALLGLLTMRGEISTAAAE
jgi:MFS family permease